MASPNKKRTSKERTLEGYKAIWTRFHEWDAQRGLVHFHSLARKEAQDYAKDLWQSIMSARTYVCRN